MGRYSAVLFDMFDTLVRLDRNRLPAARIGNREVGDPIAIRRTRTARRFRFKPAVRVAVHRHRRGALNLDCDVVLLRCPEPEARAVGIQHCRAERQIMREGRHDLAG